MFASTRKAARFGFALRRILPLVWLCGVAAGCATKVPPPSAPLSAPAALPAPPKTVPDTVTGLSAGALRAGFGAPDMLRKDGIAELWRYDGTRADGVPCHAYFFLYDDAGVRVVRHVETMPRGRDAQQPAADPACLNALRVKPS